MTSDSLAAWLAGRLGVARLALVKSAPAPPRARTQADLVAAGLVDGCLPRYCRAHRLELRLLSRGDHAAFAAALAGGAPPGLRFTAAPS